jgi:hypothetical protein
MENVETENTERRLEENSARIGRIFGRFGG